MNLLAEKLLDEEQKRLGLQLGGRTTGLLLSFMGVLMKWNRRIGLVGTRGLEEIVAMHVVDCLVAASHFGKKIRLVDVGSGAGFPGLITAICRPDVDVLLVEKSHRKAAFLAEAIRLSGVRNARVFDQDAARLFTTGDMVFDEAVSRATFEPRRWFGLGKLLVARRGVVWLMLGPRQSAAFPKDAYGGQVVRKYQYTLLPSRQRTLIGIATDVPRETEVRT